MPFSAGPVDPIESQQVGASIGHRVSRLVEPSLGLESYRTSEGGTGVGEFGGSSHIEPEEVRLDRTMWNLTFPNQEPMNKEHLRSFLL